jgi:hypothetical protein
MEKRYHINMLTAVIFFALFGCAWIGSFGRISLQSGSTPYVTTGELQKNWGNYEIYFAGGSVEYPSAVLFDPKDDDKTIINDKWRKVEDQKTLSEIIRWISIQDIGGPYYPKLYMILGPDGRFYGYMYTAWNHVLIKGIDEKTIWVDDLPHPPHSIGPGLGRIGGAK